MTTGVIGAAAMLGAAAAWIPGLHVAKPTARILLFPAFFAGSTAILELLGMASRRDLSYYLCKHPFHASVLATIAAIVLASALLASLVSRQKAFSGDAPTPTQRPGVAVAVSLVLMGSSFLSVTLLSDGIVPYRRSFLVRASRQQPVDRNIALFEQRALDRMIRISDEQHKRIAGYKCSSWPRWKFMNAILGTLVANHDKNWERFNSGPPLGEPGTIAFWQSPDSLTKFNLPEDAAETIEMLDDLPVKQCERYRAEWNEREIREMCYMAW